MLIIYSLKYAFFFLPCDFYFSFHNSCCWRIWKKLNVKIFSSVRKNDAKIASSVVYEGSESVSWKWEGWIDTKISNSVIHWKWEFPSTLSSRLSRKFHQEEDSQNFLRETKIIFLKYFLLHSSPKGFAESSISAIHIYFYIVALCEQKGRTLPLKLLWIWKFSFVSI